MVLYRTIKHGKPTEMGETACSGCDRSQVRGARQEHGEPLKALHMVINQKNTRGVMRICGFRCTFALETLSPLMRVSRMDNTG